jgi:hypothetical protein
MVYVRFPTMKAGINPSLKTQIDPKNLTATQKVSFTRDRIWGNMVGGNERSGYKELKKPLSGEVKANYYFDALDLKMVYPFIEDWTALNKKKVQYQERRQRIFMRGLKIGSKRISTAEQGMSMFEQNKAKDAAAA